MEKNKPFQAFIDLVKYDQRFHALNAQIHTFEHEVAQIEKKIADVDAAIAHYQQKSKDARKLVDEYELVMKELNEAEKNEKQRLEQVTNEKEYAAIKKEIATLHAKQQEHEKVLLDAWNKLENVQKELKKHEEETEKKRTKLNAVFIEKNEKLSQLKGEYEAQMGQRTEKVQGIPQEWLDKYAVMREQVTDPVVPVVQGSCFACFYAIPPQDLVALKQGKLVSCKDCYRLLYWEDEEREKEQVE